MASSSIEQGAPAAERTLLDQVEDFFRPGGTLQKACAGSRFAYEPRPQQRQMALAVAEAFAAGEHLVVEAGTGVGKSFAYLVPAILGALRAGKPAVVSTYTISLQEQLILKDIPFLREHLGVDFKAVLVKGRNNYLCRRRLHRFDMQSGDLFHKTFERELVRVRQWADETADGSLSDFAEQPRAEVWSQVCAEHGNCLGRQCPYAGQCFFAQARGRAYGADLLVLNHHLFFSELALRAQGAPFLPPYETLVFDEAHRIEDVATEHLGIGLAQYRLERWLKRLADPDSSRGLLRVLGQADAASSVAEAWREAGAFFDRIHALAGPGDENAQRVVPGPFEADTSLPTALGDVCRHLEGIVERSTNPDDQAELGGMLRSGLEMRQALVAFLGQTLDDHVYWIDRRARRGPCALHAAPVEVGPLLEEVLFDSLACVVMTSATLAVGGRLDYFKSRVGASSAKALCVGSPFDYERQMRLYLVRDMPDPNDTQAFAPCCAQAVERFVRMTAGRAFVLFTNAALMNDVAGILDASLKTDGFNLLVQGTGTPRHVMLEKFRTQPASVLFGLDSFWMGVDVPGDALGNVIITRLPFSVPDQPVVRARTDRLRQRGGNPFRDYALPEAVLKFRQGVGRLIRTATDEGIVVVLDNRVLNKWYGKVFLDSLPACPVDAVVL